MEHTFMRNGKTVREGSHLLFMTLSTEEADVSSQYLLLGERKNCCLS